MVLTVFLCVVSPFPTHASNLCSSEKFHYDTLANYSIRFRHDKAVIEPDYLNNRETLSAIRSVLDELVKESPESISEIIITGFASPVGNIPYNQLLSLKRAQATEAYLRSVPGIENVEMSVIGKGEDWTTFIQDVKSGYKRKNRQQVFSILDAKVSVYKKEWRLKALEKDQTTWRYLSRNYMARSRHAVTIVIVKKSRVLVTLPKLEGSVATAVAQNVSNISSPLDCRPLSSKVSVASIRTNLLVPALNVGVEAPIGNRWSVAADYYFPWFWPHQQNKNCFEFLGWNLEGRYWFGKDRMPQNRLKGHSLGAYVAGGYYDFERNYRGIQGEFVSSGVDYTYSMAVGNRKNLHLQFTIAAGYIRSWGRTYQVFGGYGGLFPDEGTLIWEYVGPTKAAVTLVVPFFKKEGRK